MSARLILRWAFVLGLAIALLGDAAAVALGGQYNRKVDIGQPAPRWAGLEGVDGRKHNLDDYKKAKLLVIAFMCNQCDVSRLYEDRFIHFVKHFQANNVAFVAVSCSLLPADRLEKMRERAREKRFKFDYLADPSQQIGRDYGATVTPQVFVLDESRHIAYMGRFDDSIFQNDVHREFAADAVRALLAGKQPDPSETRPLGCGIEYGKPNEPYERSK